MLEVKFRISYAISRHEWRSENITRKFTTGEFASYFRRFGKYAKIKSVRNLEV